MKQIFALMLFLCLPVLHAQTKVSGIVKDDSGTPVAFANVLFKNSTVGGITNDDGRFYLETEERFDTLVVSLLGYTPQEIPLTSRVTYDLEVILTEGELLDEVVVYTGKTSKKDNPALDILRKIWERKRQNGVFMFDQYQYRKYEKVEFDLNTIDSALMKSKLFKGMEFVFDQVDTSSVTGKTYLPVFINEAVSRVYGDNTIRKKKENMLGSQNSGYSANQAILSFIKDLYQEYNIYDNYLRFFDKSFVSPLSRTGIDTYNYVLSDSAYRDNKWCYKIVYYPRRSNELTFKGDFWVNDTTFAVKEINMQLTKSANINWVKELYMEQEFEVLNDSVFVLKRDYMMSDFSLRKKEESRGIYGKRTTVYDNYLFDEPRPETFYREDVEPYNPVVFERDSSFWRENRLERLSKDETGIYKMLDTLKTVPKFKRLYSLGEILASGYIEFDKWNLDYGPIYSSLGFNDAEGLRTRFGGRTYFDQNDPWRIEGYGAYGFGDKRFKYGLSAKLLLDHKNRLIVSAGTRRDIEQLGASLTATNDVLGRSFASSAVFTAGANTTLTNINLTTFGIEYQPLKNLTLRTGGTYRTLKSALPDTFSLEYVDPEAPGGVSALTRQFDTEISLEYTPGRNQFGFGVERYDSNDEFARFYMRYTKGMRGFLSSDFDYEKLQFYFSKPFQLGGIGRTRVTVEAGQTYGTIPLSLLSPIPGNQTYFTVSNTFPNLNFYEFVTDTYVTGVMEHNFNGRIFGRIPFLKKLDLREIVGLRAVWGSLSEGNRAISAPSNIPLIAPEDQLYYEYSFGIGNIFRLFRIDFNFRGNYLDLPDARPFAVTGVFEFSF